MGLVLVAGVGFFSEARTEQDQHMAAQWDLFSSQEHGVIAVLWLEPLGGNHFYAHDPGEVGKAVVITVLESSTGGA
ncbi:MAG: hypothetical protein D6E12_02005 [Desulfovibrio sp.]|nr:MAG: hypothetical protein D6E12_02005 [Desulfovibrio sp.]